MTTIQHGTNNDQNIIVQMEYDKAGRMTGLRDPRGNATEYEYDKLNRRTKLTNPLGIEWETAYEDIFISGTPTGETQMLTTMPGMGSGIYDVVRAFDRLGRLEHVSYGDASTTPDVAFAYDGAGNRTRMTEWGGSRGDVKIRETHYSYDEARRLTSAGFDTNGNGVVDQTVTYEYSVDGLRTRMIVPGGLDVEYSYDEQGRLTGLSNWASQTTTYSYDGVGRLSTTQRADGLNSSYSYDPSGHLRRLHHKKSDNTLAEFLYSVDARGNRTETREAQRRNNTAEYVFFTDNRLAYSGTWTPVSGQYMLTTQTGAAVKWLCVGTQIAMFFAPGPNCGKVDIYVDGIFSHTFDTYSPSQGVLWGTFAIASNDGPHILEARSRGEKNVASSGYNVRFSFAYVATSVNTFDVATIRYTYDALSRVRDAANYPGINLNATPTKRYQYQFDPAGNRVQEIVSVNGVPTTANHAYNAANQISNAGFSYDPNGNLISDGVNTYSWDRANRLLSMGNRSYSYDGEGRRVQQLLGTWNPTREDYLLDVQSVLPTVVREVSTPWNPTPPPTTRHFIHDPLGIHLMESAGTWSSMLNDGQGSVRMVMRSGTIPVESRQYAPYGTRTQLLGSPQTDYGYTGEPLDDNGLIHLRARYYSPALGVFASLDPLETPNRYSYVSGNPVNLVDRSGLQGEIGAACLAFALGDGPFPFGDAACLALLGIAGIAGVIGAISAGNAANQLGQMLGSASYGIGTQINDPADYTPMPWQDYTPAPPYTPSWLSGYAPTDALPMPFPGGIDPREIGGALGAICGAGLALLLWKLSGIMPIEQTLDRTRERPNDDTSCDAGLTSSQAARHYSRIAFYGYYQTLSSSIGYNPQLTFAVTRVKFGNKCQEVVAVNNRIGGGSYNRNNWLSWMRLVGFYAAARQAQLVADTGIPSRYGEHAELNLINVVGFMPTFRAMGISQEPCGVESLNCSARLVMYRMVNPISISYHSRYTHGVADF